MIEHEALVARQRREEGINGGGHALDLDQHPAGVVANEPGKSRGARQAVDVGAKADALDGAANAHAGAPPAGRVGRGRGGAQASSPLASSSSHSAWYALAWASWIRGMCSERVTTTWSASSSAAITPPS